MDDNTLMEHFIGRLDILPLNTKVKYVRNTAKDTHTDMFIGQEGIVVEYVDEQWKRDLVYKWKCYAEEVLKETLYVVKLPRGWQIAARRCELEIEDDNTRDTS